MEDPYSVENIDRLGVLMFQTSDNSQLLRRVLWINAELTIVWSLKHKNTQPSYIFNRENPQNSEPQNGARRGLDFIALSKFDGWNCSIKTWTDFKSFHIFLCVPFFQFDQILIEVRLFQICVVIPWYCCSFCINWSIINFQSWKARNVEVMISLTLKNLDFLFS